MNVAYAILQARKGLEADLPAFAKVGEFLYTTDTFRLFMGNGEEKPITEIGVGSGTKLFVSDEQPQVQPGEKYLWVQTSFQTPDGFAFWFEDGKQA